MAFQVLCKRKNITINFIKLESKTLVYTDRKVVDVVVSNLITNAIKYTEEGGEITLSVELRGLICEIIVSDTGIGILKSEQKKIFKLFYRSPQALEAGISGSVGGLILASDLAKKINGKVILHNSSTKGSTFKFIFPYDMVDDEPGSIRDQLNSDNETIDTNIDDGRIKLLFVEDDEELLNYAESKLRDSYNVVVANNGKKALDIAKKWMPDLVISDVSMPKMNGRQLCMNLKSHLDTCHIPFILLSGLSSKQNVIQGIESGADEYIFKPVDFEILTTKIQGIIENRQILKRKFLKQEEVDNIDVSNDLDKVFIEQINTYISDNISDSDLSVYDLYEISGMSRTPFYHKLKALVGLSPSEYIRMMRLKQARILLRQRNQNISEVAYSVGFSNPKYFSTSFRKYYGQSPTEFVEEMKEVS